MKSNILLLGYTCENDVTMSHLIDLSKPNAITLVYKMQTENGKLYLFFHGFIQNKEKVNIWVKIALMMIINDTSQTPSYQIYRHKE